VNYLCSIEPAGQTRFTDACKRIALTRRGKGVLIILSDFFVKEGYEGGLRLLKGQGYDVYAIQVLSPQEMEPSIGGDLRLKDMEDGDTAEVTITAPLLRKYKQLLNAYCNKLHEFCAQRDIVHITVKSDMLVDQFVMDYLRRRGLLR
jgi:dienelactone hydrolase